MNHQSYRTEHTQDRQCKHNAALRRILATIVAVEKKLLHILIVYL